MSTSMTPTIIRSNPDAERRIHTRQPLQSPAVIQLGLRNNEVRVFSGTIENISLGGVLLRVEKQHHVANPLRCEDIFEIIFRVDGDSFVASITCKVCHCTSHNGHFLLGACYTRMDSLTSAYLGYRLEARSSLH